MRNGATAGSQRWSVAECAEHIVLPRISCSTGDQASHASPAVDRPETSNPEQDRKLAGMVADRSHKRGARAAGASARSIARRRHREFTGARPQHGIA